MVVFCLIVGFFGIATAYENMREIGFGEYRQAIEYKDGILTLLDFEIELK